MIKTEPDSRLITEKIILEISSRITLIHCPVDLSDELKAMLTLQNPKYIDALKRKRWTGHLKPTLTFYEKRKNNLILPRGILYRLSKLLKTRNSLFRIIDQRIYKNDIDFNFNGKLSPLQIPAVKKILSQTQGILKAATGAGKTVMALYIVSKRKQPCLVLVPNKTLLYQWIADIEKFLEIPSEQIGIVGDGNFTVGKKITVGIINSVCKSALELNPHFGHIVIDEAHKSVSNSYQVALSNLGARYLLGLSATPYRRDGLTELIYFTLGDIVAEMEKDELIQAGIIVEAQVQWVKTKFSTQVDASESYSTVITELTQDSPRNRQICSLIAETLIMGRSLVLSDRKEHCYTLKAMLEHGYGISAHVLVGGLEQKKSQQILDKIQNEEGSCLIGTSQLLGEGFNLPALDRIFLTVPMRFKGKILQTIGRVLRSFKGKNKAMIYDFVDTNVGVLKSSALSRVKTYKAAGIENLKALPPVE